MGISFTFRLTGIFFVCLAMNPSFAVAENERPNVLFISIDDLNDWIGPLGGHPQVRTPNMDRLAKRGVVFTNAHCAAPICNPSRAAVFTGLQPFVTGVYTNTGKSSHIRKVLPDSAFLPKHFENSGYATFGTGKLLHRANDGLHQKEFFPHQRWSPFDPDEVDYTKSELPSKSTDNPRHVIQLKGKEVVLPLNRMPSDRSPDSPRGESFDWGPLDIEDSDMGDGQIAEWAAKRLAEEHERPFFIAAGFYRPHIPLYAPRKYFELYDGEEIRLPEFKEDDLDDLSPFARKMAIEAVTAGSHSTVVKYGEWKSAVKAYLACVTFVDAQVGRLLDALDSGPNADNTIIFLWSDHGWHLGEKKHWGKSTGWERSTRVPLIVAPAKNMKTRQLKRGVRCDEPVSLLDMYPTLIEFCSLKARPELSGISLLPMLTNPDQPTDRKVLTTFGKGNTSVMGRQWHYIHYEDGSEELYDRSTDPNEWKNLSADPQHEKRMAEMKRHLPDAAE